MESIIVKFDNDFYSKFCCLYDNVAPHVQIWVNTEEL